MADRAAGPVPSVTVRVLATCAGAAASGAAGAGGATGPDAQADIVTASAAHAAAHLTRARLMVS